MSRLRNPFKLRASERIESDVNFLRLFSPIALDSLLDKFEKEVLFDTVLYINSSPGSGKSSLLRIFEPSVLSTLLNNKTANDYKGIFSILKKIGVITDDEVKLLAVSLVCTRNYEILEELGVSEGIMKRYFFGLLNSRIVLATLQAIVTLKSPSVPFLEALSTISFSYDNRDNYFSNLDLPCNGKQLYTWASDIEKSIYNAIDSFIPSSEFSPQGSDELFALEVMQPINLKINGQNITDNFLFMLDDSHKLSVNQRDILKKYVIEKRGKFSIWISQRLEALSINDNLGSFEGRDYEELYIEQFWRDKQEKFGKILLTIADKRASISSDDVNSFKEHLTNNLEEESYKNDFAKSINSSKKSLTEVSKNTNKFVEWLQYAEDNEEITPYERAILYKQIEILIARNTLKNQLILDFPFTIPELLDKLKNTEVNIAAKLFLHRYAKIPNYFSDTDLIKISSNNIEQFLAFSSDLFEGMLSNRLSGLGPNITTKQQHEIFMKVANQKWSELPKILPNSHTVVRFLTLLGKMCNEETYKPNAPYAPGVTGFAIKLSKSFSNSGKLWYNSGQYESLKQIISTCISFNLLEKKEVIQGEKGKENDVFYLNRWLCIYFGLPLGYGGWRHKNIDEILKWTL